jgi:hypothetical protein
VSGHRRNKETLSRRHSICLLHNWAALQNLVLWIRLRRKMKSLCLQRLS